MKTRTNNSLLHLKHFRTLAGITYKDKYLDNNYYEVISASTLEDGWCQTHFFSKISNTQQMSPFTPWVKHYDFNS